MTDTPTASPAETDPHDLPPPQPGAQEYFLEGYAMPSDRPAAEKIDYNSRLLQIAKEQALPGEALRIALQRATLEKPLPQETLASPEVAQAHDLWTVGTEILNMRQQRFDEIMRELEQNPKWIQENPLARTKPSEVMADLLEHELAAGLNLQAFGRHLAIKKKQLFVTREVVTKRDTTVNRVAWHYVQVGASGTALKDTFTNTYNFDDDGEVGKLASFKDWAAERGREEERSALAAPTPEELQLLMKAAHELHDNLTRRVKTPPLQLEPGWLRPGLYVRSLLPRHRRDK